MTFQSHEVEPDFSVINVDAHEHFVPGDVSEFHSNSTPILIISNFGHYHLVP